MPIVIWDYKVSSSIFRAQDGDDNKMCLTLLFSFEKDLSIRYIAHTSSYYLIEDIESVKGQFPFRAKIIKKVLRKRSSQDTTVREAYVLE